MLEVDTPVGKCCAKLRFYDPITIYLYCSGNKEVVERYIELVVEILEDGYFPESSRQLILYQIYELCIMYVSS